MTQPVPYVPANRFASEVSDPWATHLDAELRQIAAVIVQIEGNLAIIQRDDTALANEMVGANTLATDALALIAGQQTSGTASDWTPRGFWLTATLYNVSDIIETGSPGTAYVCTVQHTSGVFATDRAAGKWIILSAPRTIVGADVTGALGYVPVNKAGDTMSGALALTDGSSIAGMTFSAGLSAQALVTVNQGIYSQYQSSAADIIYGFASNVVRTGGTPLTVGAQFSGISGQSGEIFGANTNAIGLAGASGPLVAHEADIGSYEPSNAQPKVGYNAVFADRSGSNPGQYSYAFPSGTVSNPGSGLGANLYNYNAWAFWLSSQARSATGEYCGWNRGLLFDEYALDSQTDATFAGSRAYPIGIDFSKIHYYGGSDPVSAFNLEAAIAFRDLQGILWNRDPVSPGTQVNKIRSHFNPFSGRWVLTNSGTERFGIDVSTGALYLNGLPFTGVSLAGNNTWTGTNDFQNTFTLENNLIFSGNSRRIRGDFHNATYASRVAVQDSTVNTGTEFGIIPNGSSTAAGLYLCSDSALANGVLARIGVDTTGVQIASSKIGSGSYGVLDFSVSGSTSVRIAATGEMLINTTTTPVTGVKLRVNGLLQLDNCGAFSANRNGVDQAGVATSTLTKMLWTTKEFDQNTNFDTSTSKWTPVAGTYFVAASIGVSTATAAKRYNINIYKNGASYKSVTVQGSASVSINATVSCTVLANGTDYFEVYVFQDTGGSIGISGLTTDTWFCGHRVG